MILKMWFNNIKNCLISVKAINFYEQSCIIKIFTKFTQLSGIIWTDYKLTGQVWTQMAFSIIILDIFCSI